MTDQRNLYSQEIWDSGYQGMKFEIAPKGDQVRRWLEGWAQQRSGSCLEIGCFPGRYLAVFGRAGLELNGVDLTPRTDTDMASWLAHEGFRTGRFARSDFFNHDFGRRFDVVYSVGFIEHFTDWLRVLERQADLVAPGGLLLVNTPNFVGAFQGPFHRWLDRANYDRHCTGAMDPLLWKSEVEKLGFRVLECGYFDELDFWVGDDFKSLPQRLAFWSLRAAKPVLRRILPRKTRAFSPYCVLAAERIED